MSVKVDIDEVIDLVNNNAYCSYDGDCTAQRSKCKNCSDFVIDYKELYKWLENLSN